MMDEFDEMRQCLNLKPDDELISILLEHDEDQWRPEVFDTVRSILRERGVAIRNQTEPERLKTDPLEKDPAYREIFESVDEELKESPKDHPFKGRRGFCHVLWEKKKMLSKKNGIDWKTPAEMNPDIIFD